MSHTPHASVAARKPVPSGIGSLMESAHDPRALAQAASDGASSEAPARPDGGPRVVEGRRVLAARAQEELAFERAAAQLRPSWASDGTAHSAIRDVPAEVSAAAQQRKAETVGATAVDATAVDTAHVALAPTIPQADAAVHELAPPTQFSSMGLPAIGPSAHAPSPDDTQALRAALYAPQRKTRVIALASVGCLLLGGLIAVFAGGGSSDASQPKPGTASILPTHAAAAGTVSPAAPQQPEAQPHANVPAAAAAQAAQAPEHGAHPAAAPEPALARTPSQPAVLPGPKPTLAKVAVRPAPLAPAKLSPVATSPVAIKPAPAKASPLAAKPAPAKAAALVAKPAPAKASALAAKPTPGKAAGKPALLSAKAAPGKPLVTGKAQKGAPSATKGTQPGAKTGRNPVDVLNPWAN